MRTLDTPLSAYCSYGQEHRRFASKASRIRGDVDRLLREFGTSAAIRQRIQATLTVQNTLTKGDLPSFDEGYRFEGTDEQKNVVLFINCYFRGIEEYVAASLAKLHGKKPEEMQLKPLPDVPAQAQSWRVSA